MIKIVDATPRGRGDGSGTVGDLPPGVRYRAFISYARKDAARARWLQRRLESYEVPSELVGRDTPMGAAPARLAPVFRDGADVDVGAALSEDTVKALDASAALIVLCSPDSAVSEHVNNEIKLFRTRHPERPVAPLVIRVGEDGLEASLPLALRYEINPSGDLAARPMEVLSADLRHEADGPDLAVAKLVASLIGVSADDIFQRAQRQQRVRQRRWIIGLGGLAAAMAVLALISDQGRREAERQRTVAEARELGARAAVARPRNIECSLALAMTARELAGDFSRAEEREFSDLVRNTLALTRVVATLAPAPAGRVSRAAVAWRGDSDELVYIDQEGAALSWRETDVAAAGAPFGAFLGRESAAAGPLTGAAWAGDGGSVAALRRELVEIWSGDGRRKRISLPLRGAKDAVWSADGRRLLVLAEDSGVFVVDAGSGVQRRLSDFVGLDGRGAAFAPSGQEVAIGMSAQDVAIFPLGRGAIVVDQQGDAAPTARARLSHPHPVVDVDWSPEGDRIAVALDDGQVWIWDAASVQRLEILNAHEAQTTVVEWSPAGDRLLSASGDGRMKIWDAADWRLDVALTGHTGGVYSAAWREDGARVASAGVDGAVRVWSTGDGPGAQTWAQRPGWVWNVAWPGEGALLAATGDTNILSGPGLEADAPAEPTAFAKQYLAGAAAIDAPLYAYLDYEFVTVQDMAQQRVVFRKRLDAEIGRPLSIAIAPDGSRVAVGSLNGLFIWSVVDNKRVAALPAPSVAIAFAPDAARLAHFNLSTAKVHIVDPSGETPALALEGPKAGEAVWGLDWSRRGDRLAAASDDGDVHVWDLSGALRHQALKGHADDVKDVAWARGDDRLASASLDGTVRIWDAARGELVTVIDAHRAGVRSVAWSGDGRKLASGGEDGAVRLFSTDDAEISALAERQAAIGLTPAERAACLFSRP